MSTMVITGASGNVGRPLVATLVSAGVAVRAVSRDGDPGRWPVGVEVVDPEAVDAALDGADAVFVNPRAVGPTAAELLAAAHARGVRRVVVLAAINVDAPVDRQPSRYRGDRNREVEAEVTRWPGEWVALRPTTFAANVLGLWGPQLRAGDRIRGPRGDAGAATIDERDVADVAAAALLGDTLVGRRVPLTGPEVTTPRTMVADLAAALGRPLEYVEVEPAAAREAMVGQGFPPAFVDAWLAMQAAAPAPAGPEVARILGRPPRSFRCWADDHMWAFRGAEVAR